MQLRKFTVSTLAFWLLMHFLELGTKLGEAQIKFSRSSEMCAGLCVLCGRNGFIFSCGEKFAAGATMHMWSLDWGSHPRTSIHPSIHLNPNRIEILFKSYYPTFACPEVDTILYAYDSSRALLVENEV
ncbi:hypothetical protein TWF569_004832 [Orbilia oligospora]|uniref:Uncharacterized protein n=1 Tax=Orbilia oligospora TaxID=2813651 RepID=A0A7C8NDE7_ORBOL|nr:hypothetical protein TWF103_005312 [Orbilia oligospora]KAF3094793.1 hypothetical protein TWF706_008070 [Orbilia oligospora]KAF3101195.1 hypothetical protein TWF102_004995 [Orbilia oligospora]KAF3149914.1 hypothetical protein TWF569_004832 [Orbilia oligospora]KAF3153107.1 hypothetical protein TWF594_000150 [Orbilia oligospora]